jgi:DNA-binding HxlR family transcriptional regulator
MAASSPDDLELNRVILEQITSKWTLLVLASLCEGPMRFNALRRAQKCLRRLEANGFIKRSVVSTAPVAVTYEISPLGRSLEPHLQAILTWAADHRDDIKTAQEAFTAAAS